MDWMGPLQNSYVEVLTPRGAVFGCGAFKEMHECVLSRSVISNSATPWTAACQAPLSMEFSRQEIVKLKTFASHFE